MNPETADWIEKAEGDWATMTREFGVEENPNYDAISLPCSEAENSVEEK